MPRHLFAIPFFVLVVPLDISWQKVSVFTFCMLLLFLKESTNEKARNGKFAMDGVKELKDELASLKDKVGTMALRMGLKGFDREDR